MVHMSRKPHSCDMGKPSTKTFSTQSFAHVPAISVISITCVSQSRHHGCVKSHAILGSDNYESQPVGLAEVVDASEAGLGGLGGRPLQIFANVYK